MIGWDRTKLHCTQLLREDTKVHPPSSETKRPTNTGVNPVFHSWNVQ